MRFRQTIGVFFSGSIMYVVMAACSSMTAMHSAAGTTGGGTAKSTGAQGGTIVQGTGGHGGMTVAGSGGGDSGFLDALTDPVSPADANPVSGSRLKRKYLLGDDGTQEDILTYELVNDSPVVGNTWWDSQLQEDCHFRLAADGKTRCVPGYESPQNGGAKDYYIVYADPACTQAVMQVPPPPSAFCPLPTPPTYGHSTIDPGAVQCSTPPLKIRVFKTGPQINPAPALYVPTGNNSCGPHSFPTAAIYQVSEIDPTSFVAAAPMIDP